MAQIALKDMSDKGYEHMSEGDGYVLHQFKILANALSSRLNDSVKSEDLQNMISNIDDLKVDKKDFMIQVNDIVSKINKVEEHELQIRGIYEFMESKADARSTAFSINSLSEQVERIATALRSMADKIDADAAAQNSAVTNSQLDVNYRAELDNNI